VERSLDSSIGKSLIEAVIIALAAAALAIAVNVLRPAGLPFVAKEEYETMVPCPEPGGKVTPADAAILREEGVFVVDAREQRDFDAWHAAGAVRLTFDYLDPVPEADLQKMAGDIARAKAQKVVVYGDGGTPDTGDLLGREISARGIRNVFFVKGGAAAIRTDGAKEVTP